MARELSLLQQINSVMSNDMPSVQVSELRALLLQARVALAVALDEERNAVLIDATQPRAVESETGSHVGEDLMKGDILAHDFKPEPVETRSDSWAQAGLEGNGSLTGEVAVSAVAAADRKNLDANVDTVDGREKEEHVEGGEHVAETHVPLTDICSDASDLGFDLAHVLAGCAPVRLPSLCLRVHPESWSSFSIRLRRVLSHIRQHISSVGGVGFDILSLPCSGLVADAVDQIVAGVVDTSHRRAPELPSEDVQFSNSSNYDVLRDANRVTNIARTAAVAAVGRYEEGNFWNFSALTRRSAGGPQFETNVEMIAAAIESNRSTATSRRRINGRMATGRLLPARLMSALGRDPVGHPVEVVKCSHCEKPVLVSQFTRHLAKCPNKLQSRKIVSKLNYLEELLRTRASGRRFTPNSPETFENDAALDSRVQSLLHRNAAGLPAAVFSSVDSALRAPLPPFHRMDPQCFSTLDDDAWLLIRAVKQDEQAVAIGRASAQHASTAMGARDSGSDGVYHQLELSTPEHAALVQLCVDLCDGTVTHDEAARLLARGQLQSLAEAINITQHDDFVQVSKLMPLVGSGPDRDLKQHARSAAAAADLANESCLRVGARTSAADIWTRATKRAKH